MDDYYKNLLDHLIEKSADKLQLLPCLFIDINDYSIELIKYILKKYPETFDNLTDNNDNLLMLACLSGSVDLVEYIISFREKCNFNAINNNGETALSMVCKYTYDDINIKNNIINILIKNGANILIYSNNNINIDTLCAIYGIDFIVEYLLKYHGVNNVNFEFYNFNTIIANIIGHEYNNYNKNIEQILLEIINKFIQDIIINKPNLFDLIVNLLIYDYFAVIDFMISHNGIDINMTNKRGETLLVNAIKLNSIEYNKRAQNSMRILKYLIDKDIIINDDLYKYIHKCKHSYMLIDLLNDNGYEISDCEFKPNINAQQSNNMCIIN